MLSFCFHVVISVISLLLWLSYKKVTSLKRASFGCAAKVTSHYNCLYHMPVIPTIQKWLSFKIAHFIANVFSWYCSLLYTYYPFPLNLSNLDFKTWINIEIKNRHYFGHHKFLGPSTRCHHWGELDLLVIIGSGTVAVAVMNLCLTSSL